ncbi:MAG: DUF3459 domain-containing protein, partial [Bifidobacterium castoris]|nr:DUF3459 domain-containing protein [Bifidobacterium castoris]
AWLYDGVLYPHGSDVIAYARPVAGGDGDRFACIVNFGPAPVDLPHGDIVLRSTDFDGYALPVDAAVWMRI